MSSSVLSPGVVVLGAGTNGYGGNTLALAGTRLGGASAAIARGSQRKPSCKYCGFELSCGFARTLA